MTIVSANLLPRLIRRPAVRGELVEESESLSLDIKDEFPSQSQLDDWRTNILIATPEEKQNAVRMSQELLSGHPTTTIRTNTPGKRMLNRQKCILFMIDRAGRPVTHLELIKWAFLTAMETPSGGGSSFYDFLPYQYGPFSFTMFRELDGLARKGYIRDAELNGRPAWELVGDVGGNTASLAKNMRAGFEV